VYSYEFKGMMAKRRQKGGQMQAIALSADAAIIF
jgi:hypothetical protein